MTAVKSASGPSVAAVLASFAVESPLTGFGAGGYMMVGGNGAEPTLIDFFVAAPGLEGIERRTELAPIAVDFDAETSQTFFVGPASCGVPGTAAEPKRPGIMRGVKEEAPKEQLDAGTATSS